MVQFSGSTISILLSGVVYWLTQPFANVLPAATLRGLIPRILGSNLGTFRMNNPHGWTSREVWEAIVAIVAEQAGVPLETLTESTSFIHDLF